MTFLSLFMTVEAESNVAFLENEFSIYRAFVDFVQKFMLHLNAALEWPN